MRVRTIFCVLLIAVMSIACNKKNDETPNVLGGIDKHVVHSIEAYIGTPGSGEFNSAVLLSYDSDLRLTGIAHRYYDDGEEILDPNISIKYGNGNGPLRFHNRPRLVTRRFKGLGISLRRKDNIYLQNYPCLHSYLRRCSYLFIGLGYFRYIQRSYDDT